MKDVILFYGSWWNRALRGIYEYVKAGSAKRVIFAEQERYPGEFVLKCSYGNGGFSTQLTLPDGSRINSCEIVSICLDNYYISTQGLDNFSEKDLEYIRTEGWATLIALFGGLSKTVLIVNRPLPGEILSCKLTQVALLNRYGFPAPSILITSDPEYARSYFERNNNDLIYKTIRSPLSAYREMTGKNLERLKSLELCPVHFERPAAGDEIYAVITGSRIIALKLFRDEKESRWRSSPVTLPDEVTTRCLKISRDLELHLCSIRLRRTPREEFLGMGITPFIEPHLLHYCDNTGSAVVLEEIRKLLEGGLRAENKP